MGVLSLNIKLLTSLCVCPWSGLQRRRTSALRRSPSPSKGSIFIVPAIRKQLRCLHLLYLRESMHNACRIYSGLGPQPLYNLFTVNENGFTPFANGR